MHPLAQARYPQHPPVFLAQTSTKDSHADLCGTKHYHDTLVRHGAKVGGPRAASLAVPLA